MIDIRGLFPFSLVDYPGKISCIIFCGGCNFRCPFCHNPCLVFDPASQPRITEPQLFHFLESRRNRLEGVVISGGEPTLHSGLHRLADKIRSAGFLVKLDTNGTNPEVVRQLLEDSLPDAFGIDYKAPASDYSRLTGTAELRNGCTGPSAWRWSPDAFLMSAPRSTGSCCRRKCWRRCTGNCADSV